MRVKEVKKETAIIVTYTGLEFDLLNITEDSINLVDIAHALTLCPRWGGHSNKFYSVAQHSIDVMNKVPDEYKLAALLHDASEAYLGDMPSPFKKHMPAFHNFEKEIMKVIANKYGFEYPLNPIVKQADIDCFIEEQKILKSVLPGERLFSDFMGRDFLSYVIKYSDGKFIDEIHSNLIEKI